MVCMNVPVSVLSVIGILVAVGITITGEGRSGNGVFRAAIIYPHMVPNAMKVVRESYLSHDSVLIR